MNWLTNYYRTHPWFKQLIDQTAHLLGAMLLLFPAIWGQFWVSALLIGVLREVEQARAKAKSDEQNWSANYRNGTYIMLEPWYYSLLSWRRALDVCFWVIGGVALQVVAR
jgi:hypothetical protein